MLEHMERALDRLDNRAVNLGKMLDRCGISPAALAHDRLGQTLIAATRACILCDRGEACQRWLAVAATDDRREAPSFCPNAGRFRAVRTG